MTRRSYSKLVRLPSFLPLDSDENVLASVRAHDKGEAKALFRRRLPVEDVRRGTRVVRAGRGAAKKERR